MKNQSGNSILFGFLAPLVIGGVIVAMWIAVTAAWENLRLGRATDQILVALSLMHEMPIGPATTAQSMAEDLLRRLPASERATYAISNIPGQIVTRNAWDRRMAITVLPAYKAAAFDTFVTPTACRRLVSFFSKDTALDIKRIEAIEDAPVEAASRVIFDSRAGDKPAGLTPSAIEAGCGAGSTLILRLIIGL